MTAAQSIDHQNELVILAFPTNDFNQEPGTNEEIEEKVKDLLGEQYDNPNFILFHKSKLEHNPIYKAFRIHLPEHEVKHNFYKYLIGRDGVPVAFYSKKQTLFDMEAAIKDELETV
jgi:glutathione peroxidase